MGKLNAALHKNVKNLLDVNEAWTEYAISCEIKAASISNKLEVAPLAEVSMLIAKEVFAMNWWFGKPPQEQCVASYTRES